MSDDFEKVFENAEKVERPEPLALRREPGTPQPYPTKAMGTILGQAVQAIIDSTQCPDAIAAQSVLAAAALSVQALADVIRPGGRKPRPSSLFMVTVGASGERKSAADELALEPIRIREMDLRDAHEHAMLAYRAAKAAYDREWDNIERDRKLNQHERARRLKALGDEPGPPLLPMLTAPDPTLEGLHKYMAVGEPSLGLFNDEGGTFIGGYGMSDESRLRTGSGLSDLWDGKPVRRVRGGDGSTFLFGRRLSLHIMVQPGIAEALLSNPVLLQQGFLSRVLVAAPASTAGNRPFKMPKAASESALKRYKDRLLKLLRSPQPRKSDGDPELTPREIRLTQEATARWIAFHDECEADLAAGQRLEPVRAFANKLAEHTLRIAAVLEIVDDPTATTISLGALDRATTLARYYAGEALRLFDQGAVSPEILRAEKVLKWLHGTWKKPQVGLAHIYQGGPYGIRQADLARQAMGILALHHWVVKIEDGAKIDGKRHGEAWEVIPPQK